MVLLKYDASGTTEHKLLQWFSLSTIAKEIWTPLGVGNVEMGHVDVYWELKFATRNCHWLYTTRQVFACTRNKQSCDTVIEKVEYIGAKRYAKAHLLHCQIVVVMTSSVMIEIFFTCLSFMQRSVGAQNLFKPSSVTKLFHARTEGLLPGCIHT